MENFKAFEIRNTSFIFGGELEHTYVGVHGDLYDTETRTYYIIEGPIN